MGLSVGWGNHVSYSMGAWNVVMVSMNYFQIILTTLTGKYLQQEFSKESTALEYLAAKRNLQDGELSVRKVYRRY